LASISWTLRQDPPLASSYARSMMFAKELPSNAYKKHNGDDLPLRQATMLIRMIRMLSR
jgi:hypothetical protein